MSCFGGAMSTATTDTYYYSSSSGRPAGGGGRMPWRWWRAKCAGIAAAVGYRLRRSIGGVDGRRRRRTSSVHYSQSGWCHHHRSFAPVYVDDLYSHHSLQTAAKAHRGLVQQQELHEPSTSARDKLATATAAGAPPAHAVAPRAAGTKATTTGTARVAAADDAASRAPARDTGGGSSGKQQQARAMAAGVAAMRNVLLRSPGRGGGGVLGVVKGMGEVDLRAELFIRKFREDMRLQSQRSAEEFQAMLARGL